MLDVESVGLQGSTMARTSSSWPALVLGAIAIAAAAVRVTLIVNDGWGQWLEPHPWRSVLVVHLVAEFLMATLPAVGVVAWWIGRRWGAKILVLGLGAVIYASLNAVGWALANNPLLAIGMVIGLIIAVGTCWRLCAHPRSVLARRTWRRTLLLVWLVASALQIYGLWTLLFATGVPGNPFKPETAIGYIGFRHVAEIIMIGMGLGAAWFWSRRTEGWPMLALIALGMFLYAGLNTTGEAMVVSLPWVGVELAMIAAVLALIRNGFRCPDSDTFGTGTVSLTSERESH